MAFYLHIIKARIERLKQPITDGKVIDNTGVDECTHALIDAYMSKIDKNVVRLSWLRVGGNLFPAGVFTVGLPPYLT